MRRAVVSALLLLAASSVVAAPAPFPKASHAHNDLERFQGEWALVDGYFWTDGRWQQSEINRECSIVVRGCRVHWYFNGSWHSEETVTLRQQSKGVEFKDSHGTREEAYSFDGDTITLTTELRDDLKSKLVFRRGTR